MPFEKMGVEVIFSWRDERGVLDWLEVLGIVILADVCLEANGKDDALVVGKAD